MNKQFVLNKTSIRKKKNTVQTYKWRRRGNWESSEGIWPLKELLFMWLQFYNHRCKKPQMKCHVLANMNMCLTQISTYICLTRTILANDFGIGPESWFSSTWNRSSFVRYPSSGGKEPESLFPFKSLQITYVKGQNKSGWRRIQT